MAMPGVGACALVMLAFAVACNDDAPPRAQLLVVVDTDLPASGQVVDDPALSGDAVIDTVRVDALPIGGGEAGETRTFLAPDARDWPLSFGVVLDEQPAVRLRIRGFRSSLASVAEADGEATIEPWSEVTVNRIVEIAAPTDGVHTVRVVLRGACMGVPPSFGSDTTCIDGERSAGAFDEGLQRVDGEVPPTAAGSWAGAREVSCAGIAPPGAVCVPGGFSVLGDAAFRGIDEALVTGDAFPLHPVRVGPFFMDRTEVSVGRLRALVAAGAYGGALPALRGAPNIDFSAYCTWLGADVGGNDALPVNCVSVETAEAICIASGGRLPREAEWEHAARGRGYGRLFPWGDESPSCCLASGSRRAEGVPVFQCDGEGPEPVGSHPATCLPGNLGDVSRDGVLDLAGSVAEALADTFQRFDADCWAVPGVPLDPVCTEGVAGNRSGRGGSWSAGLSAGAAPWRKSYASNNPAAGVRCVYPVGAP